MKLTIFFILISSFSFLPFKSNIIQPVQCTSPSLFDPFNLDLSKQSSSNNIDPNVKKVCESTDNPELCFSTLSYMQKVNNDKGKTDITTLLEMQIKAVQEAIQLALTIAEKPNNAKSSNSGRSMQALKDCKEVYTDALDNMKQALDAISRADKGTVNSMLSAAISDFGTCDDGFIENDDTSPMAEYGAKLSKLVSNCLATASSL